MMSPQSLLMYSDHMNKNTIGPTSYSVQLQYDWGSGGALVSLETILSRKNEHRDKFKDLDEIDYGYVVVNNILTFQPHSMLRFIQLWLDSHLCFERSTVWFMLCLERSLVIDVFEDDVRLRSFKAEDSRPWEAECAEACNDFCWSLKRVPDGMKQVCETAVSRTDWHATARAAASAFKSALALVPRNENGVLWLENPELGREALRFLESETGE